MRHRYTKQIAGVIVAAVVIGVISEDGVITLIAIIGQMAKAFLVQQVPGIIAGYLKEVKEEPRQKRRRKPRRRNKRRRNTYFLR